MSLELSIELWDSEHSRFEELKQVIDSQGQTSWFGFKADWHLSSHTLVALYNDQIVGFLYFVVQEIGPKLERPSVHLNGIALLEAKVIAFGVIETMRDRGRCWETVAGGGYRVGSSPSLLPTTLTQ